MTEEVQNQAQAPQAQAQQTQEQPQEQTQDASAELNVNDLNGMKTIIDLASSRGAFKPNEMVAVGQIYMKLSNFLSTVQKSQGA